jgi:hypothetical protein
LDEWTAEQLETMKLSGNANAASFFKKHGITEAQMQSEKKYTTKTAAEYRKHLLKLIQEEAHPHIHTHSHLPTPNSTPSPGELDAFMKDYVDTPTIAPSPVAVPVVAPPVTVFTKAVGKLDISSTTTFPDVPKESGTVKLIGKTTIKKPIAKKSLGAKKLDSNINDTKLVSFEIVEARKKKAAQEEEDRKLAVKLSAIDLTAAMGNGAVGGSSRVAAALRESENEPSKYRSAPVAATAAGGMGGSSMYRNGGGGSSGKQHTYCCCSCVILHYIVDLHYSSCG